MEFCAQDATRAEMDFLTGAIGVAVAAGADCVALCDTAAEMMPDDFAAFVKQIADQTDVPVAVGCDNKNGLACACAILAVRAGAESVKTNADGAEVDLQTFADMIKNCGNTYGFASDICVTELHRVVKQIRWIAQNAKNEKSAVTVAGVGERGIRLDQLGGQN